MTASVTSLRVETPRTHIDRVDESTSNDRAEVSVTLHWDGADHTGVASGPPTASFRPLLVAHATLAALQEAGLREFYAIEANVTDTAATQVALVAVEDPELDQPLIGTAVMPDDNTQLGFARATLDAVNRRIEG
jgi:hypothetical protein